MDVPAVTLGDAMSIPATLIAWLLYEKIAGIEKTLSNLAARVETLERDAGAFWGRIVPRNP